MRWYRENLSKHNKNTTKTRLPRVEEQKLATKRNITIENLYRNARSVMLCFVYTVVF